MTDENPFLAAARFLLREARPLERRLFAACFEGAPPDGVVDALRAYRNADGGFGHGLEPDKRCPASLPIDVEIAFQSMAIAGAHDAQLLGGACDFLAGVAVDGAVPLAFPVIEEFPRAAHWTDWTYERGVNPTAGLAGHLWALGFDHPWRAAATRFCWDAVETGTLPGEVHGLSEVMTFLAYVPERDRAEKHAPAVLERMVGSAMFQLTPKPGEYGLTPLHVAPTADSPWRRLFSDGQIEAHLDQLAAAQLPDGGWPVAWEPPSEASRLEWRGIVTFQAVRTLTSYGRLVHGEGGQ
ncbi:hypothetical protein [Actinoplanes sp. NPDC049802]|uniref:hypothetical protein n=1 Tax=Actinoplanes sp. NPDC049802 TaxID=3154742 RepID=UPI0033EAFC56